MLFIMFNDFEKFIVIKGNDKEEYAKDAVTGKMVHLSRNCASHFDKW